MTRQVMKTRCQFRAENLVDKHSTSFFKLVLLMQNASECQYQNFAEFCCTKCRLLLHKMQTFAAQNADYSCTRCRLFLHKVQTISAQGADYSCTSSSLSCTICRLSCSTICILFCTRSRLFLHNMQTFAAQYADYSCTICRLFLHNMQTFASQCSLFLHNLAIFHRKKTASMTRIKRQTFFLHLLLKCQLSTCLIGFICAAECAKMSSTRHFGASCHGDYLLLLSKLTQLHIKCYQIGTRELIELRKGLHLAPRCPLWRHPA
jgi:hypothetical protein